MKERTKILVTGAKGQLGSEIKVLSGGYAKFDITFIDIDDLDLTDKHAVSEFFEERTFDYVINCAAYTAVDKAESDKEAAFTVNAYVPELLGEITGRAGTRVIHISTDYVFDGKSNRPYETDHVTNPVSVYGTSKLKGEELLLKNNPDSIIIRTAWLYSAFGNNFVKTMIRLGKEREELRVVYDQVGSPTYARDLAKAIFDIINSISEEKNTFVTGVYHYTNEGVASWFDFAYHILKLSEIECKTVPVLSEEFPAPAPRPAFSVLSKSKIRDIYSIEIPHWYDSLKNMLSL